MSKVFSSAESFIISSFSVVTFAVVLFCGSVIIKCFLRIIKTALLKSQLDKLLVKFLLIVIKICMGVCLCLYALSVAGFSLSGFVAALSAITLAIGLAIQDIIAGVASGMMVVSTHPFKVGDYVEVDGCGGSIQEVSLFHTILNTPDNKRILIPNKNVFNGKIVNYSSNPIRRLDLFFGLEYSSNREIAFKSLLKMASDHPLVLKDPAPAVMINEYQDSNVVYLLRVWVNTNDYWSVNYDLNKRVLDILDKNNLGMSYPRVVVSYDNPQKEG